MAPRVLHGEISMAEARAKLSSGTLLYRHVEGSVEVLLVHPSGNYNRRAPWGIPKGAPNPDETLEATALRDKLMALKGSDLAIDASAVERIGALCAQVLMAAAKTWEADKRSYTFAKASEPFLKTMQLIGVNIEHLLAKEIQR